MMTLTLSSMPFMAESPTTIPARRGVASGLSLAVHVSVALVAISGIWSQHHDVPLPPEMVVEVVLDHPPPPQPAVVQPPAPLPKQVAAPPKPVRVQSPHPLQRQTVVTPDARSEPAADAVSQPAPMAQPVAQSAPPAPVAAKPAFDPRQYLPGIKEKVQSQAVYPPLSLRRGEQGTVHVQTVLAADGSVIEASAVDDNFSQRLRDAAIKAVRDAAPFASMAESVKVTIPVVFEIR